MQRAHLKAGCRSEGRRSRSVPEARLVAALNRATPAANRPLLGRSVAQDAHGEVLGRPAVGLSECGAHPVDLVLAGETAHL